MTAPMPVLPSTSKGGLSLTERGSLHKAVRLKGMLNKPIAAPRATPDGFGVGITALVAVKVEHKAECSYASYLAPEGVCAVRAGSQHNKIIACGGQVAMANKMQSGYPIRADPTRPRRRGLGNRAGEVAFTNFGGFVFLALG